jgi:hypothetical protein
MRYDAGFAWAQMLHDAFDRPVLSARITAFKYDEHLMPLLDDMPLNLDEFDLKRLKRGFVGCATIWITGLVGDLRH